MKISKILNVLLAAGLLCLAIYTATGLRRTSGAGSEENSKEMNKALENIMTRTSVRAYSPDTIGADTVEQLLRAAMAAPSAMNRQPWEFVVITDRAQLDSIAAHEPNIHMAAKAPLAIVVCGNLAEAIEGDGRDFWIQDVSAATENLLLAAHATGLGAVWCGVYPVASRVEYFRSLLGLPEDVVPVACVVIGHPQAPSAPKDKWKPAKIHYSSY